MKKNVLANCAALHWFMGFGMLAVLTVALHGYDIIAVASTADCCALYRHEFRCFVFALIFALVLGSTGAFGVQVDHHIALTTATGGEPLAKEFRQFTGMIGLVVLLRRSYVACTTSSCGNQSFSHK